MPDTAIPDVFLGAFDSRATLVDTKSGQTVPTHDAIFILTSNYGAEEVRTGDDGTYAVLCTVHVHV